MAQKIGGAHANMQAFSRFILFVQTRLNISFALFVLKCSFQCKAERLWQVCNFLSDSGGVFDAGNALCLVVEEGDLAFRVCDDHAAHQLIKHDFIPNFAVLYFGI